MAKEILTKIVSLGRGPEVKQAERPSNTIPRIPSRQLGAPDFSEASNALQISYNSRFTSRCPRFILRIHLDLLIGVYYPVPNLVY